MVSIVCEEMDLRERVDQLIPSDPQMDVSFCKCLNVLVINGLGFAYSPLIQKHNSLQVDRYTGY